MIGLDRLMSRKGVVAAGMFTDDGQAVRAVGTLSRDAMARVARLCARHQHAVRDVSIALELGTELDWRHLNGWVLWAGRHALCVSGDTGVLVEAAKADFNQLQVDLFGPTAGQHPKILMSEPELPAERAVSTHQGPSEEAEMDPKLEDETEFEVYDLTLRSWRPARPMQFLKDAHSEGWLCDIGVDPDRDLAAQGCWRCGDMAFPMGI